MSSFNFFISWLWSYHFRACFNFLKPQNRKWRFPPVCLDTPWAPLRSERSSSQSERREVWRRTETERQHHSAPSFAIQKTKKQQQQQHPDASMNARLNDVPLDELGVFFKHDVTMLREWLCPTPELPYRSREEGRKNGQTPVKAW